MIDEIWSNFTKLFGDIGSSRSGFHISCYDQDKRFGIIRCSHFSLKPLRAAMAIINKIDKIPILIHILTVSGTIKKLLNIFNLKAKT